MINRAIRREIPREIIRAMIAARDSRAVIRAVTMAAGAAINRVITEGTKGIKEDAEETGAVIMTAGSPTIKKCGS